MEYVYLVRANSHRQLAYSTFEQALTRAPEVFFGGGIYTILHIEMATEEDPYFSFTFKMKTKLFPEGIHECSIYITPVSINSDNPDMTELSTEDIDYIKGLQSTLDSADNA